MLRNIWLFLALIAVANLLALAGFIGWLLVDKRLDMERVDQVREIFSLTLEEEAARLAEIDLAEETAAEAAEQEARNQRAPISAAAMLEIQGQIGDQAQAELRRMEREVEDLQRLLSLKGRELDEREATLEARETAFESARAQIEAAESDEQFRKTVALYESVKPQQAKDMLQALIDEGETTQAIAYLNAMGQGKASKVLRVFGDADPKLAKDLLERLRTFGLGARADEGP